MWNYPNAALVLSCLIVMLVAYRVPRAWYWIAAALASFVGGVLFWGYGDQKLLPIFNLLSDAMICCAVWYYAEERWEAGVFNAFWASNLVSICRLAGWMTDNTYANLLDICTYSALAVIGGMGLIEMVGRNEHSRIHPVRSSLRMSRHIGL